MAFLRALGVFGFSWLCLVVAVGASPASGEDGEPDATVVECPFPDELATFKKGAPERLQRALKAEKVSHEKFTKAANLLFKSRIGKKPKGYTQKDDEPEIFSSNIAKVVALRQFKDVATEKLANIDTLIKNHAWIGGEFAVPERVGQFMSKPVLFKAFRIIDTKSFMVYQGNSSTAPMVIVEGIDTAKLMDGMQLPQMEYPAYVSGTHDEGGKTFLVLKKIPPEWLADVPPPAGKEAKQLAAWRDERQNILDRIDKEIEKLSK